MIVIAVLLAFGCDLDVLSQTDDARIEKIHDTYKQVNDQIAESEKAPEYSSIFVTELVVNKHNASYPAVGIFNTTMRFYYTYGDREKNAYPDRLLKIMVTTRRSSQIENYEYLFDPAGKLIFEFEKVDDVEKRYYFSSEKLIRYQEGQTVKNTIAARSASTDVLKEAGKLVAIFRNSL